jgi:predicted Zn-dependent peptidase
MSRRAFAVRPATAAALLLLSMAAGAQEPAPPVPVACSSGTHFGLQSFRLANGMTFLLVEHPDPARVAAGWIAHVGGADDPAGLTGISHVTEHMMFKGTHTIGVQDANELDAIYNRAGATLLNAFTRNDFTAFVVSLPANELELWFWMESDRLLAPVFRGLDSERMVIEQERQRAESTPWSRQQAQFNALFWKTHPYRWPLFGWPAHVAAISVADIERHFQTYYSPSNLTAVLVGHLDRARIEELARRYFGRIAARPEPPRIPVKETGPLTETRLNAVIEGQAQLQIRYHTVPFRHPDSYPLEVLAGLLNGPRGRLQIALVQTAALAQQATAEQTSEQRGGFFSLIARASGDHEPEELERAWAEVIDGLAAQPVPQDEVERVKNRLIANYFSNLGSPPFLMVEMLTEAGMGDWKELDDHACRLAAVSAEDVRRVVRTYFAPPNRTVGLYRAARRERRPGKS